MAKRAASPERTAAPTARGEATRARIMQAASDQMLAEGYAAFSARAVAARAGVALSLVQYYFPTPADIVAALLDRFIFQYADEVMARFRDGKDKPEQRLTRALDYLLNDEAYRRECTIFMLEVSSLALRNPKIASALKGYYAVYLDAVMAILAELNPALTTARCRRKAMQCIALIEGIAQTRNAFGPDSDAAFTAQTTARAIERLAKD